MPTPVFDIEYLSEYAVSLRIGDAISELTLRQLTSLAALLRQKPFTGFIDTVSAYTTISVFYDPTQVAAAETLTGETGFEKVANYLSNLYRELQVQPLPQKHAIVIPVCYGGLYGPDLEVVAAAGKFMPGEVIALHTAGNYKVYMMGFVPGFAYLGGMNERLATPRKAVPRKQVPAGSVGIAGLQTGVYSMDTPGGWQIIGRTPFVLFEADRSEPSLLRTGDEVNFESITPTEFERLRRKQDADNNQYPRPSKYHSG